MANVLIICREFPNDMASGLHLRVHHLCRVLAQRHDCYLVDLSGREVDSAAQAAGPFREVLLMPPFPSRSGAKRRHLRLSNGHFLEQSFPGHFRETVRLLRKFADARSIDVVASFAPTKGEVGLALDLPKLIDLPDSDTLTTERMLANRGNELSFAERLSARLALWRGIGGERRLVRGYDVATTISEPDRRQLLKNSGVADDRVVVLPNGVAPEALSTGRQRREAARSVVFWGNLDFPPNWTAVRHFYKNIYLPCLADQGVDWHILGRNPGPGIQAMASHPRIHLAGFQEHLFDYIADKGVMVNPMVEGSGLKNKVLEAFAVGLPVVSTQLGVDALPVSSGSECMIAEEPEAFARSVLALLDDSPARDRLCDRARAFVEQRYAWDHVGGQFAQLVSGLASQTSPSNHRETA